MRKKIFSNIKCFQSSIEILSDNINNVQDSEHSDASVAASAGLIGDLCSAFGGGKQLKAGWQSTYFIEPNIAIMKSSCPSLMLPPSSDCDVVDATKNNTK